MARVCFRPRAGKVVLDRLTDPLRAGRRGTGDEVGDSHHAPDVTDHPLDLVALEESYLTVAVRA